MSAQAGGILACGSWRRCLSFCGIRRPLSALLCDGSAGAMPGLWVSCLTCTCLALQRSAPGCAGWLAGYGHGQHVRRRVLSARFVATHPTPGGFGLPLGAQLRVAEAASRWGRPIVVVSRGDNPAYNEGPAVFGRALETRAAPLY